MLGFSKKSSELCVTGLANSVDWLNKAIALMLLEANVDIDGASFHQLIWILYKISDWLLLAGLFFTLTSFATKGMAAEDLLPSLTLFSSWGCPVRHSLAAFRAPACRGNRSGACRGASRSHGFDECFVCWMLNHISNTFPRSLFTSKKGCKFGNEWRN